MKGSSASGYALDNDPGFFSQKYGQFLSCPAEFIDRENTFVAL
jgi:hypothetical protein